MHSCMCESVLAHMCVHVYMCTCVCVCVCVWWEIKKGTVQGIKEEKKRVGKEMVKKS